MLTFAVASSVPAATHHLALVCAELGRALSCEVIPKVLPSYAALSEEIARDGAHIAWAPPLVAIELERSGLVALALCCSRGGQVGYRYTPDRTHARAGEIIPADFAGYLVRDAWKGWQTLTDVSQAGCNAHARRPFAKVAHENNADAAIIVRLYAEV